MPLPSGPGLSLNSSAQNDAHNLSDAVSSTYVIITWPVFNVCSLLMRVVEQIYRVYATSSSPIGYSYQEALSVLKSQGLSINVDQLIRGVQKLCDDGRLYSTKDDEHYLSTDQM